MPIDATSAEKLAILDHRRELANRATGTVLKAQRSSRSTVLNDLMTPMAPSNRVAEAQRVLADRLNSLSNVFPVLATVDEDEKSVLETANNLFYRNTGVLAARDIVEAAAALLPEPDFASVFSADYRGHLHMRSGIRYGGFYADPSTETLGLTGEQTKRVSDLFLKLHSELFKAADRINANAPKSFWTTRSLHKFEDKQLTEIRRRLSADSQLQNIRRELQELLEPANRAEVSAEAQKFDAHQDELKIINNARVHLNWALETDAAVTEVWRNYFDSIEGSTIAAELKVDTADTIAAAVEVIDIARGVELSAPVKSVAVGLAD